jgi:MFS family permease
MLGQFLAQFAIVRVPEHRAYRDLLLARLISALGTWTTFYAVRIALYQQTGSAWWVSILLFSELVPGVVLGIAVGPLIDRWPRQRMMILSDLGGALAFGVLPFVHSPAGICGVSAIAGFSAAFFRPGCYAAIPNLVAADSVVAGNALMQGAENLATLAGPVLAGVGIVLLGKGPVYELNAFSFVLSALLLVRIGNRLQTHVPVRIGRTHRR